MSGVRAQEASPRAQGAQGQRFELRVLGGFDLFVDGAVVPLPLNVRRLLALLAVRDRPQHRATLAYTLWMDTTEARAKANLRSTLWKLGPRRSDMLQCQGESIGLAPGVEVDLVRVLGQAKRLIGPGPELLAGDTDTDELIADLLPGWDEEWLVDDRERLRQLRVHALEALCRRLGDGGRDAEAVCAGQAAVAAEPLRESAQCTLIRAHMAEGNVSEARRQLDIYHRLLWDGLGLTPSRQILTLIGDPLPVPRQR